MIDMLTVSPSTGDGFNPIIVGAIAIACLAVALFLVFSKKR